MKVQKFESSQQINKVFNSHSNRSVNNLSTRKIRETDPINDALLIDSIDDPILPQLARKFKKAYNILFPAKVVKEAKNIKNQIDSLVDGEKFQAIA